MSFLIVQVTELNQELKFPYDTKFEQIFPKWKDFLTDNHVLGNSKTIVISKIRDIGGICDFFRGIINNHWELTTRNIQTIIDLFSLSGYDQFNDSLSILSASPIDVLRYYIQNHQNLSPSLSQYMETIFSDKYAELLDHPDILAQLPVPSHYLVLSKALEKNPNFSKSKFIRMIIDSLNNEINPDIQSLFAFFSISDFEFNDFEKLSTARNYNDGYFRSKPYELTRIYQENYKLKMENGELRRQNNNYQAIITQLSNKIDEIKTILETVQTNMSNKLDSSLFEKALVDHIDFLHHVKEFKHDPAKQFNGIINHLKIQKDNVQLSCSSISKFGNNDLYNIIDYSNQSDSSFTTWKSQSHTNEHWVQFYFKNHSVNIFAYEIKSSPGTPSNQKYFHPKSWKLLGSNDQTNWVDIDEKNDSDALKDKSVVGYFECSKASLKYFKYIRFVQTEEWKNQNELDLGRFELYGNIFTDSI